MMITHTDTTQYHIGFSYNYSKLRGQTRGLLVGAFPFRMCGTLSPETLAYDTDGVYQLKDGDYIQLVFLGNKEIPFTTYRKATVDNKEKYFGKEGTEWEFWQMRRNKITGEWERRPDLENEKFL